MSDVRITVSTGGPAPATGGGPQPGHSRPRRAGRGRHRIPTPLSGALAAARSAATGTVARRVALSLVLGLGATLRVGALSHQPLPGPVETAVVTQVVDITRWIMTGTEGPVAMPLSASAAQLAVLSAAIGSWGWAPSVLDAVRGAGLSLWLMTSAQVWLVARRLGAGGGVAAAAVAVLALAPVAVQASVRTAPENVAALWLLATVLLLVRRAGPLKPPEIDRARTGALVGMCLGLATSTTPVALALAPTAVLVLARRPDAWRAVPSCILTAAVVLTGATMLGVGPAGWLRPGWLTDPITTTLGVLLGLGALVVPRFREIALGLLALSAASCVWQAPALILPLAVAVGAAILAARHTSDPGQPPAWLPWWTGPALGAVALAWAVHPQPLPWTPGTVAVAARAWLAGNLPADEPVRADRPARAALAVRLADWDRFAIEDDCRVRWSSGCSSPWRVGEPSSRDDGMLVARFGPPDQPDGLTVRTRLPQPPDPVAELRSRQIAGGVLASSPRLTLTSALATQLRAGLLDPRACTALGALAGNQRIRLLALTPVPGDTYRTLRQLSIAPDGPAPDGAITAAAGLRSISAFFRAQLPPFRPFAMAATPTSIEIRYSPYTPPGLLSAFLPAT